MNDKIHLLHEGRHWSVECLLLEEISEDLGHPSIRKLAEAVNKSKSWVDKSLQLARGLRVYSYLKEHETRHAAYRFILKKRQQNRLIKK